MTCCLDCEDRVLGCHSVCKRYKNESIEYNERKNVIQTNKSKYQQLNSFRIETIQKTKRIKFGAM